MFHEVAIAFFLVALAELGDKTQLSIFLLATRSKSHFMLFAGSVMAFLLVDGVAIVMGCWISQLIPGNLLKILVFLSFEVAGIYVLVSDQSGHIEENGSRGTFVSGFILTFMSEWGDKTQLISGALAARYNAISVLAGVIAALMVVSLATIYLGSALRRLVNQKTLRLVSGVGFMFAGFLSLLL